MSATEPLSARPTRRAVFAGGLALAVLCPFSRAAAQVGDIRRINLHNTRTGERLDAIYYHRGTYIPEVMERVNMLLRDVRADSVKTIDPRLVDIVSASQYLLGHDRPFQVISGYRTPKTNAALRRKSKGVARNSYHIRGMAVDLRMSGVDAPVIDRVGKHLGCGGVGLYTGSNFVHLDSGPVRTWGA